MPPDKRKTIFREFIKLRLILFMVAALPIMADWMAKRYQVSAEDLVLPLLMTLATSLIVALVLAKSYYRDHFATLIGGIFADLVLNQNYNDRLTLIIPMFRTVSPFVDLKKNDGIFHSLIFVLLIFALTFLIINIIGRIIKQHKWSLEVFANAIFITVFVAFIFLLIPISRTLIIEWPQFFYRPAQISVHMTVPKNKPDIYYIVLDRYTSDNVLQNQFGFNNTGFNQFLKNNNFSVNSKAFSNYPYTTMSIASTMNANYNSDIVQKFGSSPLQILEPYHDAIRYASVTEKLKSLGYSYYQLGTWYETDNKAPLADYNYQPEGQLTIFNHIFTLNTFAKMKFTNSLYYQFARHGIRIGRFNLFSYSSISESDATTAKLTQLSDIADQQAGSKFIFAHILVPHDPYYFNADGSISSTHNSDNIGEPIKQKYLGQVKFINSEIQALISHIRQKSDNKAVIVLQSDEGPYPAQLSGQNFNSTAVGDEMDSTDMRTWPDQDLKMKYGILAAYNIPGAKQADLDQANSVNIFRVIFNTYFDANMPYLTECNYAFPDGRSQPFIYSDITARLIGFANPACPTDSKFK